MWRSIYREVKKYLLRSEEVSFAKWRSISIYFNRRLFSWRRRDLLTIIEPRAERFRQVFFLVALWAKIGFSILPPALKRVRLKTFMRRTKWMIILTSEYSGQVHWVLFPQRRHRGTRCFETLDLPDEVLSIPILEIHGKKGFFWRSTRLTICCNQIDIDSRNVSTWISIVHCYQRMYPSKQVEAVVRNDLVMVFDETESISLSSILAWIASALVRSTGEIYAGSQYASQVFVNVKAATLFLES